MRLDEMKTVEDILMTGEELGKCKPVLKIGKFALYLGPPAQSITEVKDTEICQLPCSETGCNQTLMNCTKFSKKVINCIVDQEGVYLKSLEELFKDNTESDEENEHQMKAFKTLEELYSFLEEILEINYGELDESLPRLLQTYSPEAPQNLYDDLELIDKITLEEKEKLKQEAIKYFECRWMLVQRIKFAKDSLNYQCMSTRGKIANNIPFTITKAYSDVIANIYETLLTRITTIKLIIES